MGNNRRKGRDRRIPDAHWLVSLAKRASFGSPGDALFLNKVKNDVTRHLMLISENMYTHAFNIHMHICTHMRAKTVWLHIERQKLY